jgi:hypothetical protein
MTYTNDTNNNNIIRTITTKILTWFEDNNICKNAIGYYYTLCHYIIIGLGGFLMLFDNNPVHLIILLIVISLDAFANVVLHNCPLTALEEKYLGKSIANDRRKQLKGASILYKCKRLYESQLELLINVWTMITCKILVILFVRFVKTHLWNL